MTNRLAVGALGVALFSGPALPQGGSVAETASAEKDIDYQLSLVAQNGYDFKDSVRPGDRIDRAYKLVDPVDKVTARGTMDYECVVTKSFHADGYVIESVCDMNMDVPGQGKLALHGFGPTNASVGRFTVSVAGGAGAFADYTGELEVLRSEWTDRTIAGRLTGPNQAEPAPLRRPSPRRPRSSPTARSSTRSTRTA